MPHDLCRAGPYRSRGRIERLRWAEYAIDPVSETAAVIVKARGTPIEGLRAASSRHDVPVLVVGDDDAD